MDERSKVETFNEGVGVGMVLELISAVDERKNKELLEALERPAETELLIIKVEVYVGLGDGSTAREDVMEEERAGSDDAE